MTRAARNTDVKVATLSTLVPTLASRLAEEEHLAEAIEHAKTLLADPEDSWYAVAICRVSAPSCECPYTDSTTLGVWPMRYYDICPGAHADMPKMTRSVISSVIWEDPEYLVTRDGKVKIF